MQNISLILTVFLGDSDAASISSTGSHVLKINGSIIIMFQKAANTYDTTVKCKSRQVF